MVATPLAILVLAVINFIRASSRRGTIALQALASLVVWVLLTFGLIMILMVIIFSFKYPLSPSDELKSTGVFILGAVIYLAVGAALIYWTRRQAALSVTR
jgi:hypothetical protein